MKISVIIPVLNEERTISSTLETLPEGVEVVVVDGGSTDQTCARAARATRVLSAAPGRSSQLNAGAAAATGDVLLFLHSDSRLPALGLTRIRQALDRGYVGGGFLSRFDSAHLVLRFGIIFRDWRSRVRQEFYGDQAVFVRRDVFEALGGYRPLPIMEDYDFVRRMRLQGPLRIIPDAVVTSARRYLRHGILRQHWKNFWIRQRFLWGADPAELKRSYEDHLGRTRSWANRTGS